MVHSIVTKVAMGRAERQKKSGGEEMRTPVSYNRKDLSHKSDIRLGTEGEVTGKEAPKNKSKAESPRKIARPWSNHHVTTGLQGAIQR